MEFFMDYQSFSSIQNVRELDRLFASHWTFGPFWLDCLHRLLKERPSVSITCFQYVYTSPHVSFVLKVLKRYVKCCEEEELVAVAEYVKRFIVGQREGDRNTVMAIRILSHAAERGVLVKLPIPPFDGFDQVGFVGHRGSCEFVRLHVNYYRLVVLQETLCEQTFFDSFTVDDKILFKALLHTRSNPRYYVWMVDNVVGVVDDIMEMLLSDRADLFLQFLLHAFKRFDLSGCRRVHQELLSKLGRHQGTRAFPYNIRPLLVRLQQALITGPPPASNS